MFIVYQNEQTLLIIKISTRFRFCHLFFMKIVKYLRFQAHLKTIVRNFAREAC
jgi:hypothetical protein